MPAAHDGLPTHAESTASATPDTTPDTAVRLLALLGELAREIRPSERLVTTLTLDSHLERELALDSLARAELLQRIKRTFHAPLDERMLLAETPRDLLALILGNDGEPAGATPVAALAPVLEPMTVSPPEHATTLLDVLDWYDRRNPDRVAIQIYGNDERIATTFTYAGLAQGARTVATGLQARGLQPRQTVALMLPTGADYFLGFFGILLAGGVPVPIYPPVRPSQLEEHLRRHARLLSNAQTVALITVPEAKLVARLLQSQVEELRHVVTVADLQGPSATWNPVPVRATDLAFLQYTSGSTGDPKGVMLSHANLLANLRAMGRHLAASSDDVFVSWLPLYHDMGLIGACLGTLYHAFPLVVMSPLSFLARPVRWLRAIHRHRGTLSAAPNFAYELCWRGIQDHELEGLDLSSWRMAANGAEPVSPTTVERFIARFGRYGFRPEAMAPVYGLAECSVGLALQPPGRAPIFDSVQRAVFMANGRAEPADAGD